MYWDIFFKGGEAGENARPMNQHKEEKGRHDKGTSLRLISNEWRCQLEPASPLLSCYILNFIYLHILL